MGVLASYFIILRPLYNIFFHPLRKYPGPKLFAASSLPYGFCYVRGTWYRKNKELHDIYGPIVRIGPDELSFICPEAWEDVYGRYIPGKRKENPKPVWFCGPDEHDMIGANLGDHGRMRRVLAPGFTAAAMSNQEPLIKTHVDLLMSRLSEMCSSGKNSDGKGGTVVNVLQWFTYCTFDIIGDLAFGEPFGCLRDSMLHPWLQLVFANIYVTHVFLLCKRIPFFYLFLPLKTTFQLQKDFNNHATALKAVIERRRALPTKRHDFMEVMISSPNKRVYMTEEEIFKNAVLLTGGGAETAASALSGMMYILSNRPDIKRKLVDELHHAFATESEITMNSVGKLTYTGAFVEEGLRYYPPAPNAMWRTTPPEGNTILGDFIPGKTILGIPHRVAYRSERNWKHADEFHPERWLPDEQRPAEFDDDRRDVFHPFSYGPRSCIATSLASAEMRYILSRFLWNFDVDRTEQSQGWMENQKAYLVWDKPPLPLSLKPVEKV
ncbi:cytochrome p450 [Colletotrichum sojae]|uniref:Cytochrome p450 n=1 Tax=Colletotrichum sojae TaxID=2175907 RepID=A0A8H6IYU9_9PEZI|nr:cytochrome p450 [Colletotrichum sojae]